MKKMRLDLEILAVESFDATPREGGARGTVRGEAFTALGCPSGRCTYPELGSCASSCEVIGPCGCAWVTEGATCLPHHC